MKAAPLLVLAGAIGAFAGFAGAATDGPHALTLADELDRLTARMTAHQIAYGRAKTELRALRTARAAFRPGVGPAGVIGGAGPQGVPGERGPAGPPWSARAWAVVANDGVAFVPRVERASAGASVTRVSGAYCVRFPDVSSTQVPAALSVVGADVPSSPNSFFGSTVAVLGSGAGVGNPGIGGTAVDACPIGDYQVLTVANSSDLAADVSFSLLVP